MAKVDPEALEREADELFQQMMAAQNAPESDESTEEAEEETPTEQQESEEPTPSDQEETVEAADTDPEPEAESGEAEDSDSQEDAPSSVWEERYKNAQARMTKATQEASRLRKDLKEAEQRISDLERSAKTKASSAEPTTELGDKDLEQLMKDYPEVVGPLIKRLQVLEGRVGETVSSIEERDQKAVLDAHFAAIRAVHPDFSEVIATEDWEGWLERQSPTWQRIAGEGSADEVNELLTRYKDAMGMVVKPQVKREAKVEQARKVSEPKLPKARKPDPDAGKKVWSMSDIQRMTTDEFLKYEAEIDKAMLEGRVRG
jgi:hypothetical protein